MRAATGRWISSSGPQLMPWWRARGGACLAAARQRGQTLHPVAGCETDLAPVAANYNGSLQTETGATGGRRVVDPIPLVLRDDEHRHHVYPGSTQDTEGVDLTPLGP